MIDLDRTSFPRWRDRIARVEEELEDEPAENLPRSYPGYPTWPLPRVRRRRRLFESLGSALLGRRSARSLDSEMPPARALARILWLGHGIHTGAGHGPVPSAGGLRAIELYLAVFRSAWLPAGLYCYLRGEHHLAQIRPGGDREHCEQSWAPALATVSGGALLWIVVGDGARARHKYGDRGEHFLALEAGHLMQNLCLLSHAGGLATVPLGGFYERPLARALVLPSGDRVLYTGVCGRPTNPGPR